MDKNVRQEIADLEQRYLAEMSGIEYEDSEKEEIENTPEVTGGLIEKNIRVSQKMISLFIIENWISDNILNLRPDYQRNLVWDEKRKSALIESILLGIPIPAFYFDEDEQGKMSVIDGLQRLSTIHQFI